MTWVELAPEARQELIDARAYYAALSPALGQRFAVAAAQALDRLASSPDTWPTVSRRLRRYVMTPFPYSIIYRTEGGAVLVVAIAHQRRRFGYWRGR